MRALREDGLRSGRLWPAHRRPVCVLPGVGREGGRVVRLGGASKAGWRGPRRERAATPPVPLAGPGGPRPVRREGYRRHPDRGGRGRGALVLRRGEREEGKRRGAAPNPDPDPPASLLLPPSGVPKGHWSAVRGGGARPRPGNDESRVTRRARRSLPPSSSRSTSTYTA